MANQKIIFEKEITEGKYQAIKNEAAASKKIIMHFIGKNKSKIIWEIEIFKDKISIVVPFWGIRWPTFSAVRSKTFIEIPKQLTEIEKLNYPPYMRRFLTDSSSTTTSAWLNLNGRRRNLGYFGKSIRPSKGGGFKIVHKEFLQVLSQESGIKVQQFK